MEDALTRSPSGLANQHLFFDVEFVVYCEGGVDQGNAIAAALAGSDQTHDASFWRALIATLRPHSAFHVKSVGSRKIVEELALVRARQNIDSIVVCIDSDFDGLNALQRPMPPLMRTWGYSWENDIADKRVALCVFRRVRGDSVAARAAADELAEWHDAFFADCERFTLEDAKHVICGRPGVYDRDTPLRSVGPSLRNCPRLDEAYLEARIDPTVAQEAPEIPDLVGGQHCFGKFLLKTLYHAISHFAARVRKLTLDFDSFVEVAISCFAEMLLADATRREHYEGELSKFPV